jgi:hypothetical protein
LALQSSSPEDCTTPQDSTPLQSSLIFANNTNLETKIAKIAPEFDGEEIDLAD